MADAPTTAERAAWSAPWTDAELADMGLRSALDGGRLFCGVTAEAFAIGNVTYGWARGSKLTLGLEFSALGKLSDLDVKDAISMALKEVHESSEGIRLEITNSPQLANIYLRRQRLDGAMGVLADCEIPPPGSKADARQLRMRFDDSEGWVINETPGQGQIDFYRVFLHELEHGLGLGHAPANLGQPALIAPTYSRTLRNLQAADKAELMRRYGPPAPAAPLPTAPPTPVPGGKPVLISGTINVTQPGSTALWSGPFNAEVQRVK